MAKILETKIAGVSFDGRQAVVAQLYIGEQVLLFREPGNRHDPSAVQVLRETGDVIGYLPRNLAASLAPDMDASGVLWEARVTNLVGSAPDMCLGVRIAIEVPEGEPALVS